MKRKKRPKIINLEELVAAGISVEQVRELMAAGISIDEIEKSISENNKEMNFIISVRLTIIRGVSQRSQKLAEALACAFFQYSQKEQLKTTVTFTWPATHKDSYRYAKRKTSARIVRDVIEQRKAPDNLHVTIRLVLDTR